MKNIKKITYAIIVIVASLGFVHYIAKTSLPMYKTTFVGKPAYGTVNPDGTYSFFWTTDLQSHICTLPSGEAAKLH